MSNSRIQTEILLGALFIVISSIVLLYMGFREETKLAESAVVQQAQAIEVGAGLFAANCARCHGQNGEGLIGPPLNDAYFFTDRIKDVGWGGTLEDYIISTVSSGRPVSTRPDQWPGEGIGYAMPAWSQEYGGPLRPDEIRAIAQFILNWEATALEQESITVLEEPVPVSEDPTARGLAVFNAQGCAACHAIQGISSGQVGPDLTQIGTLAATRVDGMSAEDYIRESILNPDAFIAPECPNGECPAGVMPPNFGDKLSPEELDDLVAFLLAQE